MKLNYHKLFSTLALGAAFAFSANAETKSEIVTIDFESDEIGTMYCTNGGGPNPDMKVVENPYGDGKVLYISGVSSPENPDVWSTMCRIPSFSCPSGFNFSNLVMIELSYYATVENAEVPFSIKLKNPGEGWQGDWTAPLGGGDPEFNKWVTVGYDPTELVFNDDAKGNDKAGTFGFAFGMEGSTRYYIDDITFMFEKEVTQREIDEENLNKETAACVSIDFDNLEANPAGSEFVGSNGGMTNRADMIIDKGPEGYNNNCVHIIYGGHTNIMLWNLIEAPAGYTFDDLRLVEYDIYETEEPGVDCTNGNTYPGKNGSPLLKIKDAPWSIDSNANGSDCGNGPVEVNKWSHVEFRPSGIAWAARDFNVTEGEGDDAVSTPVHWDADQTRDEMGKLTKFNISVGFFPCLNQCYVDNVKLWFQKSGAGGDESGIADIVAPAEEGYTVYNLQGIRVLKTMDKNAVSNLPAGLYIVNGKKYIIK